MTAAEILSQTREIVSKYNIAEAYYKYDRMQDPNTDTPEWIRLTYAITPDLPFDQNMAFRQELRDTLGESIGPFAAHPNDQNMAFAREHYVPLFS